MKKILYLTIVTILFSTCSNDKDCSGFPEKRKVWFPYYKGELVNFSSGNASQTFAFNDVYSTLPYTIYGNESLDCECMIRCYSDIDSVNNIQMKCDAEKLKLRTEYKIQFQHFGWQSKYYVPTQIDFFEFDIKTDDEIEGAEIIDELELNNQIYNDVLKIEIDTISNKKTEIYKVYLAPECGIIRYDYRNGKSFKITNATTIVD